MLDLGEEAHLELSVGIDFKELLKTFFEDRVTKGICHDVVSSSLIEAGFHFQNTNLIQSRNIEVDDDSSLLCTGSQIRIVLDGLLKVLGVFFLLLDIKVRTNLFLKAFRNNGTWAVCDGATDQSDNSRASARTTSSLKETDSDIQCGTYALLRSVALFDWPRIWLKVIQD